jgi:hypothetical protein
MELPRGDALPFSSTRWTRPPLEQLRTALRLAEHQEDFRRLEAFARLLGVYTARASGRGEP